MNKLKFEILNKFATGVFGGYKIRSLDFGYDAWVIKDSSSYGVAIEYDGTDFFETFSNAALKSVVMSIGNEKKNVLYLYSSEIGMRDSFASICADFVEPGIEGVKRKQILENPMLWWEKWQKLIGNAIQNKSTYDIIGELFVLKKLLEIGENPNWAAIKKSTHDIETKSASYEIKSSTKKTISRIHVNSQFQLSSNKKLYLIFNRVEQSIQGVCIDDLMKDINRLAPLDALKYESYLSAIDYQKGNHYRREKYKILECRKYFINDNFPRITEESFKGDNFPNGISHIEYDVDLEGIPFENWNV